MSKKIAIIGGGISGLCTALKLVDNNQVYVFEKDSDFGGLSKSIEWKGYYFDIGPHAFHTNDKELIEEFKEIMDNEIISFEKKVLINFNGKYYKYPLKPFDILFGMNPFFSFWCIINLLFIKTKYKFIKTQDISADKWLYNRFGKPLYKLFFEDITKKVWGVHPNKLSSYFAKHRIPTINLRDIILRGIFNRQKSFDEGHKFAPQVFRAYYPNKKGIGYFIEKLANKIKSKGGELFNSSEITKINLKNNKVYSIEFKQKNKIITFYPEILISTMPLDSLIKRLNPLPKLNNISDKIAYRSLLILCIVVNKDMVFKPLHLYFKDKFFHRLSEIKNFNRKLFPKGKTGLMAEITCNYNDNIWKMGDKEVFEKAVKDIEKERFFKESDVEDYFIIRIKHAYPMYLLGFEKALNEIYMNLSKIKNLYSTGRQGLFRYIDIDICMKNAFDLAYEINTGENKKVYDKFDIEETPYM